MVIETKWLTDTETIMAVTSLLNSDLDNGITELCEIGCCENGDEAIDVINSVDDGYFPFEHNNERKRNADEIEAFMAGTHNGCYAFFIKNYFSGLIKINYGG